MRSEQEVSECVADVVAELIDSAAGVPDEVVDRHCGGLLSFSYSFCTIELRAVDSPSSLEMVQAGLREP